jgi:hypothetical protein
VKILIALSLTASLLGGVAHAGENADNSRDITLWSDFNHDVDADTRARTRQAAQCSLDARKYLDEHPGPAGMTGDQTYTFVARTLIDHEGRCMEAAGYPRTYTNHLVPYDQLFNAQAQRIYDKWRQSIPSAAAWLKDHIDHRLYGYVQ